MAELLNCRRCGRLFASAGATLCPECIEARETDFDRVREWLDRHPGGTAAQAAEATGVSLAEVTGFIREGRLRLTGGELTCERCGAPIPTGRFCERCVEELGLAASDRPSRAGPPRPAGGRAPAPRTGRFHTRPNPDD
ncbi:MAG: MerR family transcriptional regulator [Bacillota bacterium]|nr:MerR family transcriptional regulator [Bacillota bacterium]